MNGAILGMTRNEIQSKLDEIIDFSGCERYIDTPVKRYSSGMTVRLGFAVAAFLDPEILVVDEVLAVGDAEFQKKAIGKMKDVSTGEGRTVLFVSHNMASVKALCKTGVLLQNGMMRSIGPINHIVDEYLSNNMDVSEVDRRWDVNNAPGGGCIKVLRSAIVYDGKELTADKPFDLVYEFYCEKEGLSVGLNPHIFNQQEVCLFNIWSGDKPISKGCHKVRFHIPAGLFCPGSYRVDNMFYSHASEYFTHRGAHYFAVENTGKIDFTNYLGVIYPSMITSDFE